MAALLGASLALPVGFGYLYLTRQEPSSVGEDQTRSLLQQDAGIPVDNPAWQYARAFQLGDWDTVISKTLWMQERLAFVREHPGTGVDEATALESLRAELRVRDKAKNRISLEGVEDQYIFKTDALLEMVELDVGNENLSQPAVQRSWIRVTYPQRVRALLDADGMPVRSLLVGVNTTASGQVLKANIVGNVEIAYNSLSYTWEQP